MFPSEEKNMFRTADRTEATEDMAEASSWWSTTG